MFKKKTEFPLRPKFPTKTQILEDLENAESDDPAFIEFTVQEEQRDETFKTAKEFMMTTSKLKELEKQLIRQKEQLEESFNELQKMSESIKQQAAEALSNVR